MCSEDTSGKMIKIVRSVGFAQTHGVHAISSAHEIIKAKRGHSKYFYWSNFYWNCCQQYNLLRKFLYQMKAFTLELSDFSESRGLPLCLKNIRVFHFIFTRWYTKSAHPCWNGTFFVLSWIWTFFSPLLWNYNVWKSAIKCSSVQNQATTLKLTFDKNLLTAIKVTY